MSTQDIVINLLIGTGGSVIASIIVILYTRRQDKTQIQQKYSGPVGDYLGYGLTSQGSDTIINGSTISDASIVYLSDNKLQLTLNEIGPAHQWSGIVAMETETYGTISWRYNILHGKPVNLLTHRFGFKRLMFLVRDNKKIVYLVGEEGYGKEILIQKPQI